MNDSPLKVLLLASRFEVRGSSSYTLRLVQRLKDHNVTATVVCSDARAVDPERRAALAIEEYAHLTMPFWGRLVLELMRRNLSLDVPDLLHVQSCNMLSRGAWLARRLRCPLVLTVHDCLGARERLRFDRRVGRRIIAVSESVRSALLQQAGLAEDLVTVIHSGVDTNASVDLPPVLDPGHVAVVGTAGPLETIKGLPYFLNAAQKVLESGRDVEFLVSGAGPEESRLRRLATTLGIDRHVAFVPNLFDFYRSLAAMDIFCLPSLSQGLGTIMLEAMALGKPVIATQVGGVEQVVRDNETGLNIPPSNSGRLSERILELLDDPVRARAIGEAGRQLVRSEFGVERMVASTTEVYRNVLEQETALCIDAVAAGTKAG